jgi:hypothetical protein
MLGRWARGRWRADAIAIMGDKQHALSSTVCLLHRIAGWGNPIYLLRWRAEVEMPQ